MRKLILLLCVFVQCQEVFSGTVNLDVSIEVHALEQDKYSFMYCEMGICEPFGKTEGYDLTAFENMNRACKRRRRIDPIVNTVLGVGTFAALAYAGPMTGILVFAAGQPVYMKALSSSSPQGVRLTNDTMPGLLQNSGSFRFSLDDFVMLRDGLRFCHNYYETTPGVWLQDCERSLECKRDLAKDLYLSDEFIARNSALQLFMLKVEAEQATRIFSERYIRGQTN